MIIEKEILKDIADKFDSDGDLFKKGSRNTIKLFNLENKIINVKSFKKPNLIKRVIYKNFRSSKAQRSFENGSYLLSKGFLTPEPFGYIENFDFIGLKDSYYFSEHLENAFVLENVVLNASFPNREEIIKNYAQFFFKLHDQKIEFIDNSLGNTLIKFDNNNKFASFYLVDLNRMATDKELSLETRLRNLSKLTLDREVLQIIANEYALLWGEISKEEMLDKLFASALAFHRKLARKRNLKNLRFFDLNNLDVLAK